MTSTTSLKLPEELKAQIAETAKKRGKTAHALMVETLQQAMNESQMEDDFYREAQEAYDDMLRTNVAYSFEEVKKFVHTRVRGDLSYEPVPHALDPSKPMRPELRKHTSRKPIAKSQ